MAIEVTEAAIAQVKKLVDEGKVAAGALVRFGVKGGGCSGYSYVLDFAAKQRLGDRVVEKGGIKFLIDAKSLGLLDGSTVDFHKTIMSQGFVFVNPNAKTSCGCGTSFGV